MVAGSAVPLRPPEPSLGCDMNVFPGARFAFLIPRSQKLIARTGAIGCLRPFDQFEAIQRLARQREPMLKMRVNYDGGRIGLALRSLFARLNWFEAAT